MKLKIVVILFVCSLIIPACKSKDNSETKVEKHSEMIKVLIKQIENGYLLENHCCVIHLDNYSKEDLLASFNVSKEILINNGFRFTEDFKERVKLYFGRDEIEDFVCVDFFNKCNNKLLYFDQDGFEKGRFFYLSKKYPFLTQLFAIPELIDYESKYPDITQIEDTVRTEYTQSDGQKLYKTRWKDAADLSKQRDFNVQLLIHRNKYLFNDSQASLTWLLNYDKGFICNLLLKFGYDKNDKINKFVLNEIYELVENKKEDIYYNYANCEGLLYSRDCNGKLKINYGILHTLKDITSMDNKQYLIMIDNYLTKINSGSLQTDLSEEEKIQLYCIFGRTELDILKEYPYAGDGTYAQISWLLAGYQDKYKETAEKNKYWDIVNFDDIEKVVEWEYPIANEGEDKEPYDYTTLK